MRITKLYSIFIVVIAVYLLSGCMLPREEDLLPPDLLQPEEVNFRTVEVEKGTIQDILEDTVVAGSSVHYEMTFHNRSGFLAELDVRPGQEVKMGDILARLDTGSLEIDILRQGIEVEKRKLTLEEVVRMRGSSFSRRHAELDLEIAELTLQQLEEEFAKSTITAPVDGEVVFLNNYSIGEFVPGRSVVMTIADPKHVQFEYTGTQTGRIRHAMEATISIDSLTIPARVTMTPASAPSDDWERFRNTVIISVENPEALPDSVRLGSRYRFSIFIEEKQDVIVIPRSAMLSFMGQNYVQVLDDGLRTERDIAIGINTATLVEVQSGLEEGEMLIIGIER
jgi:macrolide-specific efflux system membrane fusion protein